MKKPSTAKTEAAKGERELRRRKKMIRKAEKMIRETTTDGSSGHGEDPAEVKKGPWTAEEDELLVNHIKTQGEGGWRTLPKRAGLLRCGKSCRLRWMNYLRPNVKRGHITPDEEDLILRLHRLLGNRWSLIAGRIPGRTDNEIKNYWNTHLSKKLIRQGVDPRTHKLFSEPHLIPPYLIKPKDDKGSNHDDDDVTPDNAKLNSVATATVSQSSSSNQRAHHLGVSSTNESSPTEENNINKDDIDKKNLSMDDGKVAEEEYQQHISSKNLIHNTNTSNIGSATYDIATTIATTTAPTQSTTGLDLCCNVMSQVRVQPNYSTNASTSVQQLLDQHFNDGYGENMLVDEGDDDLFSSFLNSLINDEMIFPCNNADDGSQSRQDFGALPAAPPAHQGGGGDSHAVTMNFISATSSLGFQMIDRWDGPCQ